MSDGKFAASVAFELTTWPFRLLTTTE